MAKATRLEPLLDIASIVKVTTLARSTISRRQAEGTFPRPEYVSNKRVWRESTIKAWLAKEMSRRPESRSKSLERA